MGMLIACADSDVRLLQCNVNECCVLVSRLRKVPAALYGQGLDMLDATITLPQFVQEFKTRMNTHMGKGDHEYEIDRSFLVSVSLDTEEVWQGVCHSKLKHREVKTKGEFYLWTLQTCSDSVRWLAMPCFGPQQLQQERHVKARFRSKICVTPWLPPSTCSAGLLAWGKVLSDCGTIHTGWFLTIEFVPGNYWGKGSCDPEDPQMIYHFLIYFD